MKNLSKTIFSTAAAVAVLGTAVAPVAEVSAWGDNAGGRTGYTIQQINDGVLGDSIVFNSITDGSYTDANGVLHTLGDERNFVRARFADSNEWKSNEIVAENGKEYVLSLYVHNNSPKGYDAVAKDTTVRLSIPSNSDSSLQVDGMIKSSNATITKYWDDVVFKSADGAKFHLEYITGSSLWESNGASAGALSDSFVSQDTLVGYDSLNGEIPGCYQYSGYASARVKVVYDDPSDFILTKQVRIKGSKDWSENVDAKVGDIVEYMIGFDNTSDRTVNDVLIKDMLPENMEYVAGSTILKNANYVDGLTVSDNLTGDGINIGGYTKGSNAYVKFEAKVVDKTLECNKNNKIINWAKATVEGVSKEDDATVSVAKVCTTPSDPTPSEMPKTGADFSIAGALGAGSIVTALGYYIASRKKLM